MTQKIKALVKTAEILGILGLVTLFFTVIFISFSAVQISLAIVMGLVIFAVYGLYQAILSDLELKESQKTFSQLIDK